MTLSQLVNILADLVVDPQIAMKLVHNTHSNATH